LPAPRRGRSPPSVTAVAGPARRPRRKRITLVPPRDAQTTLPSVLETIVAHKRQEVAERRAAMPGGSRRPDVPEGWGTPRAFRASLQGDHVRLIAEVKKASP